MNEFMIYDLRFTISQNTFDGIARAKPWGKSSILNHQS